MCIVCLEYAVCYKIYWRLVQTVKTGYKELLLVGFKTVLVSPQYKMVQPCFYLFIFFYPLTLTRYYSMCGRGMQEVGGRKE